MSTSKFNSRGTSTLTRSDIFRVAPSAFQTNKKDELSEGYRLFPTMDLVEVLQEHGWNPYHALQSRTRVEGNEGHQRHMIVMQREASAYIVGDTRLNLLITNSSNGKSAYHIYIGLYRKACSNGNVVCDQLFQHESFTHNQKNLEQIMGAHFRIVNNADSVLASVERMHNIQMSESQQIALARASLIAKWGQEGAPIEPARLLLPRRLEDIRTDLWTTYNKIQENLIVGGVDYAQNGRHMTTRSVNSVDTGLKLNQALHSLAYGMQQIKETGIPILPDYSLDTIPASWASTP